MSIGAVLGLVAIILAAGAAAIRSRDTFWGVVTAVVAVFLGILITRRGLDGTTWIAGVDSLLVIVGAFLFVGAIAMWYGLPRRLEDRLYYGPTLPELNFERKLVRARQPFLDAARARDDSSADRARWRRLLPVSPPSPRWATLAEQLERNDEDWAERARSGADSDAWLAWQAQDDQINAEWRAVRAPIAQHRVTRVKVVRGLGWVMNAVAAGCIVIGSLGLTSALESGAPEGRAAVVPEHPSSRRVYLAPIGAVSPATLQELAAFYKVRYDLDVGVLPPAPQALAPDATRSQVPAEGVIGDLIPYPEAADENNIIIGILAEDIYSQARPDLRYVFGRPSVRFAVISTFRMNAGPFGHRLEQTRLRKMVTRYIGFIYFGLPPSTDPHSVLYDNIGGPADLDRMGENY